MVSYDDGVASYVPKTCSLFIYILYRFIYYKNNKQLSIDRKSIQRVKERTRDPQKQKCSENKIKQAIAPYIHCLRSE